jgi:methyltransferase (TIGR00027 family)
MKSARRMMVMLAVVALPIWVGVLLRQVMSDAGHDSLGAWVEHTVLYRLGRRHDDHSDVSRAGVGSTALKVAALRAMESHRTDRPPLVHDPVAVALFSSHNIYNWDMEWIHLRLAVALFPYRNLWPLRNLGASMAKFCLLQDLVAVRTAAIDAEILHHCCPTNDTTTTSDSEESHAAKQLVVVGAGLDARSVRLADAFSKSGVRVYELDFPSMLEAKWDMFGKVGYARPTNYAAVATDFSMGPSSQSQSQSHQWIQALLDTGYDPSVPSIWLAEGLTGYLTQEEVTDLFRTIGGVMAKARHSVLLATFVGTLANKGTISHASTFGLHRYRTDTPCVSMVEPLFGPCAGEYFIGPLATRWLNNVPNSILSNDTSYSLIKALKQ